MGDSGQSLEDQKTHWNEDSKDQTQKGSVGNIDSISRWTQDHVGYSW